VSPAVVRPLHPRDAGREPDVVEAPVLYPRVAPGTYIAVTRHVAVLPMFGRRIVRLLVELHETLEQPALASGVPWFLPVPARASWRAASTSAIVRLFQLLAIPIPRRGPLPLQALVNKALRVELGDVVESRDRDEQKRPIPLPPPLVYSVVRRALERLA
jgi:hypothetical protein